MRPFLFIFALLLSFPASADCRCTCVNGSMQALCDSAFELAPLCPMRLCPLATPTLRPLSTPRLPPLGTSFCRSEQVWTGFQYEWVQVCR
jgi:hypothetical protein